MKQFFTILFQKSKGVRYKFKHYAKNALSNFKKFISFRNKISLYLSLIVLICDYIFILGVGLTPKILGYKLGPSAITLGIMAGWLDRALHYFHRNLYLHRQLFFRQRARRNA